MVQIFSRDRVANKANSLIESKSKQNKISQQMKTQKGYILSMNRDIKI